MGLKAMILSILEDSNTILWLSCCPCFMDTVRLYRLRAMNGCTTAAQLPRLLQPPPPEPQEAQPQIACLGVGLLAACLTRTELCQIAAEGTTLRNRPQKWPSYQSTTILWHLAYGEFEVARPQGRRSYLSVLEPLPQQPWHKKTVDSVHNQDPMKFHSPGCQKLNNGNHICSSGRPAQRLPFHLSKLTRPVNLGSSAAGCRDRYFRINKVSI